MLFLIISIVCILLFFIIFVLLQFNKQTQYFYKEDCSKLFESLLYRPMDIVHYKYYKKMQKEEREQKIRVYASEVLEGYKFMKNKKIIVCGLLYNAESQVKYLQSWFDELKLITENCVFVIVENNSQDKTREYLEAWKKNDPIHIHLVCTETDYCESDINQVKINTSSPDSIRIRKMAFLRNCYVKYIQENFLDFDYVFIKDLDLDGSLFWDGIFHSFFYFKHSPNIDVITCNGILKKTLQYYDTFAYAKDKFDIAWNFGMDKRNHDQDVIQNVSKYYQKHMELDKVASAFGGFGIYKMEQFKDKFYNYDKKRLSCEHCIYHLLYDNVHVNPQMIFLIDENKT